MNLATYLQSVPWRSYCGGGIGSVRPYDARRRWVVYQLQEKLYAAGFVAAGAPGEPGTLWNCEEYASWEAARANWMDEGYGFKRVWTSSHVTFLYGVADVNVDCPIAKSGERAVLKVMGGRPYADSAVRWAVRNAVNLHVVSLAGLVQALHWYQSAGSWSGASGDVRFLLVDDNTKFVVAAAVRDGLCALRAFRELSEVPQVVRSFAQSLAHVETVASIDTCIASDDRKALQGFLASESLLEKAQLPAYTFCTALGNQGPLATAPWFVREALVAALPARIVRGASGVVAPAPAVAEEVQSGSDVPANLVPARFAAMRRRHLRPDYLCTVIAAVILVLGVCGALFQAWLLFSHYNQTEELEARAARVRSARATVEDKKRKACDDSYQAERVLLSSLHRFYVSSFLADASLRLPREFFLTDLKLEFRPRFQDGERVVTFGSSVKTVPRVTKFVPETAVTLKLQGLGKGATSQKMESYAQGFVPAAFVSDSANLAGTDDSSFQVDYHWSPSLTFLPPPPKGAVVAASGKTGEEKEF